MCDSDYDEDTIVVITESDMNSRKPRKKLPESRTPDTKKDVEVSGSENLQRSPHPRSSSLKKDLKFDWSLRSTHRHQQGPDEPREFIWRYMHRNGLYSQNLSDKDVLDLVHKLGDHVGISPTDGQLHSVMCENVKAFISSSTKKWHIDGLLIECWHPDGVSYRRSPKFEALLKQGPNPCSTRISTENAGSEPYSVEEVRTVYQTFIKRNRQSIEPVRPEKRRKGDHSQGVKKDESPSRAANELQTPPGSAFGDANSPIGSPVSVVLEPDNSKPTALSPSNSGWVAINNPGRAAETECPSKTEAVTRPTATTHSENASKAEEHRKCGIPVVNDNLPSGLVDTLPSANSTSTSSPLISAPPPQTTSPSPILFIPQKRNLSFDFAHPLPSLRDLTVSDFFALFASRSGHSVSKLHVITFDVIFAGRSRLVLRREDSEAFWKGLKRRISLMFGDVRRRRIGVEREEGCWEVWVREGEFGDVESEGEGDGERDEFEGL